jgi:hypothetical protein
MQTIKSLARAKAQDQLIATISTYFSGFEVATWILTIMSFIVLICAIKAAAEFSCRLINALYLSIIDIKRSENVSVSHISAILWSRLNKTLFSIAEDYT